MYKCKDCGNIEKFIGFVSERGNAYIYQDTEAGETIDKYAWAYFYPDKNWKSSIEVKSCYFCNSKNIAKF